MKDLSKEAKEQLRLANLMYFMRDKRFVDCISEVIAELTNLMIFSKQEVDDKEKDAKVK